MDSYATTIVFRGSIAVLGGISEWQTDGDTGKRTHGAILSNRDARKYLKLHQFVFILAL